MIFNSALGATKNPAFRFSVFCYKILVHLYSTVQSGTYYMALPLAEPELEFLESMGARHRGGIGLSYRPARLHRLAEFIPWYRFLGSINFQKYGVLHVGSNEKVSRLDVVIDFDFF